MDHNENAVFQFNRFADEYQKKYMDLSAYAAGLDLFCGQLAEQARVLDVACGPGNISRYVLDRCPTVDLLGVDQAVRMVELAKRNNPGATFMQMDARKISTISNLFDGILIGFLLPYLTSKQVISLFKDLTEMMPPGGILYISSMENPHATEAWQYSSQPDVEPLYTYYHPKAWLEEQLMHLSLGLIHQEHIPISGSENVDLVLVARKN